MTSAIGVFTLNCTQTAFKYHGIILHSTERKGNNHKSYDGEVYTFCCSDGIVFV